MLIGSGAQVREVLKDGVLISKKGVDDLEKVDAGTTVWCTGIKMNPLAEQITQSMPPGTQVWQPLVELQQSRQKVGQMINAA